MTAINAEDVRLAVADGVTLHGRRRRPADGAHAPRGRIVCLPGLTRNERDFDAIATRLAEAGHDVVALSLRGRGQSSYADYRTYHPAQYQLDVIAALDRLGWADAVFLGTSLGGITTMLAAQANIARIRAAIINDVGTELAPEGIARIVSYMASRPTAVTDVSFEAAKAAITAINRVAFPDADEAFWDSMTRRTYRPTADGLWTLDYDPAVSMALAELGPAPDLSPGWAALSAVPTLLVRGAISDLLTPEIVARMRAARPGFGYVEAKGVGHAPMLDEPDVAEAILRFLDTTYTNS